jgi:hypothetical protein
MILYRPLMRSVNLLSFMITKYPNINRRAFSCTKLMMMDGTKDGRIWTHSPYQNTPSDTGTLSSQQPTITRCPLPTSTPRTLPEDKLHYLSSKSSSGVEEFVETVRQSKADFYKSQFKSRVTEEDRKRIERRTVESPNSLGKVDITIYYPEISSDDKKLDGYVFIVTEEVGFLVIHIIK